MMRLITDENRVKRGFAKKAVAGAALFAAFASGMAAVAWVDRAQAAPEATPAPTSELALQIAGKGSLPLSISPDSIPSDYRLVGLIDAQGKSGYYVTRGDTLLIGGDNYLMAYEVTIFNDEAGEMKIARGESLTLSLINLHTLEIISHMGPMPEVGSPPPPTRQPQQ